jgi:hypothetical protein
MIEEPSQDGAPPLPAADDAMLAQHRHMLRLALGATLSLTMAEMADWELSFLITVLLIQFLASPGGAPGLRQGVAIIVVLGLTTGAAATLSALLIDMPALLAIVLGIVLFLAFVLQRTGRSQALGTLILVPFGFLPVVAVQEPELVPDVAFYLVRSGAVAVLWVWLLNALLPNSKTTLSRQSASAGAAVPASEVTGAALIDMAVLLPVLLLAMTLEVSAALVIILTVTAILSQHDLVGGRRVALGLFSANLLGGGTALIAYQLLSAVPTPSFLAALLLLVSLIYARLIVIEPSRARLFVTALITFIIVFGMGIAPFLDEPGATLAIRVRNLAIACVYAFVALSLVELSVDRRRQRDPQLHRHLGAAMIYGRISRRDVARRMLGRAMQLSLVVLRHVKAAASHLFDFTSSERHRHHRERRRDGSEFGP